MWIWQFLNELLPEDIIKKIKVLGDNKISLTLARNLESQNHIKHINVIHHHVCGIIEDKKLEIKLILSSKILVDSLTKVLLIGSFERYQGK